MRRNFSDKCQKTTLLGGSMPRCDKNIFFWYDEYACPGDSSQILYYRLTVVEGKLSEVDFSTTKMLNFENLDFILVAAIIFYQIKT